VPAVEQVAEDEEDDVGGHVLVTELQFRVAQVGAPVLVVEGPEGHREYLLPLPHGGEGQHLSAGLLLVGGHRRSSSPARA
jgi:hypothetical protein